MSYQYISFFMEDDDKLAHIKAVCEEYFVENISQCHNINILLQRNMSLDKC